jgi:subtilisin family serine protease
MGDADARALSLDPLVDIVEENAWGNISSSPQTITEPDMWYLDRIDGMDGKYWYSTDGTGVYVYVIDGGVERNHIEFDNDDDPTTSQSNPRVKDGPQFGSDSYLATNPGGGALNDPDYRSGTHGTAVASIIGGKNIGVAKNVNIVPIKIANYDSGTQLLWWCWGLDWIASPPDPGGDIQRGNPYPKHGSVANMSMWIDAANPDPNIVLNAPISSFEATVNDVVAAGVPLVVSANNQANSNCTTTPARMAYTNQGFATPYHVISVGGTDEQDRLWRCQLYGDCVNVTPEHPQGSDPGSNTGPCVDMYAPAHNIKAAYNALVYDPNRGYVSGYYNYRLTDKSGTSFAAPIVTGIAARLLQRFPNFTPQQLWTEIYYRAMSLPANFDGDGILSNDVLAHLGGNE